MNKEAPHQAIISIVVEILERNEFGQMIGMPISRKGKVYTVTGKNLEECEQNLEKFLRHTGLEVK